MLQQSWKTYKIYAPGCMSLFSDGWHFLKEKQWKEIYIFAVKLPEPLLKQIFTSGPLNIVE